MKKRILSILLTVCLLMALLPTVAFAEGSVTYLDADGTLKTSPSATEVTSSDTKWTGTTTNPGWYVVNTNVTIGTEETPQRVTVSGDVRLILTDGCTLTVNGGIQVQDDDDDAFIKMDCPEDFAILTPYSRQIRVLKEKMPQYKDTRILTVHKSQGREWDTVILSVYDNAFNFSEGLAMVLLDDKYGFIDKSGKEVIPCRYDDAARK